MGSTWRPARTVVTGSRSPSAGRLFTESPASAGGVEMSARVVTLA